MNNVYVSRVQPRLRRGASTSTAIPFDRVVQLHLAGHTNNGTHIVDTHIGPVIDEVWQLYARACRRSGEVSTLFEWDEAIPSFEQVRAEAAKARPLRGAALEPADVA